MTDDSEEAVELPQLEFHPIDALPDEFEKDAIIVDEWDETYVGIKLFYCDLYRRFYKRVENTGVITWLSAKLP